MSPYNITLHYYAITSLRSSHRPCNSVIYIWSNYFGSLPIGQSTYSEHKHVLMSCEGGGGRGRLGHTLIGCILKPYFLCALNAIPIPIDTLFLPIVTRIDHSLLVTTTTTSPVFCHGSRVSILITYV